MSDTSPKTIPYSDVFRYHEGDAVSFLDHRAVARLNVANGAIQTLTAVLMQRELDAETVVEDPALSMSGQVAIGLMEALACCADLIHITVNGIDPHCTGVTNVQSDSDGAKLIREASRRANELRFAKLRKGGA